MARACHDEHLYASVLRATGGLVLPMRGSSAAHDKAEDHKSERAVTREQQIGCTFKNNCLLEMLRNGNTFLRKSCAASFTGSSLTCSSFTYHLRARVAWILPLADDN